MQRTFGSNVPCPMDWTVVAEITDEMSHVVNVVCACQIGKYVFARISDGARLRLGGRSPNHLAPFRAPDLDAFEDELRDRPQRLGEIKNINRSWCWIDSNPRLIT